MDYSYEAATFYRTLASPGFRKALDRPDGLPIRFGRRPCRRDFTAILTLKATPFQLGLLSAARLVPSLLTALFAGAWVDRLRRRPILIVVDLARAALLERSVSQLHGHYS